MAGVAPSVATVNLAAPAGLGGGVLVPFAAVVAPYVPGGAGDFAVFLLLPVELQLKVWEGVDHPPRLIDIFAATRFRNNQQNSTEKAGPAVPALLHTCRNSREVALRSHYLLQPDLLVFVNPRIDTLIFYAHQHFDLFLERQAGLAPHLLANPPIYPEGTVLSKDDMLETVANVMIRDVGSAPADMNRYEKLKALKSLTLRHRSLLWMCGSLLDMWGAWGSVWAERDEDKKPKLVFHVRNEADVGGMSGVLNEYYEDGKNVEMEFVED